MNEVYTDLEPKRPYQSLYDRCREKDKTLTASELSIVEAAYPELVKDFFKQEKYFTPSLEDIRVGYECEEIEMDFSRMVDIFLPEGATHEEYREAWGRFKCTDKQTKSHPYTLTKEDVIEFIAFEGYSFITGKEKKSFRERPIEMYIRTPYLSKEQIEAEGWVEREVKIQDLLVWGEYFHFEKNGTSLLFYKDYTLHIFKTNEMVQYNGPCKDINTFRYICKLLNI